MNRAILPYAVVLAALFLPKLNIIALGGATYIRLDDILIGLYIVLYGHSFKRPVLTMKKSDRWILVLYGFVAISLVSAFYNASKGNISLTAGIMFAVRHIEYAAYILVGIHAYHLRLDHYKLFSCLVLFLAILVPLQAIGIVGVQSNFDAADRAIGNTAGPFELAIVSAFLFLYFWEQKVKPFRLLFLLLAMGILFATKSRITTVAVLLIGGPMILQSLWTQLRSRPLAVLGVVLVFLPVGGWLLLGNSLVLERFQSFVQMDSAMLRDWVTQVPIVQSRDDYMYLGYEELLGSVDNVEGDTSALIRFYRWALLLNYVAASIPALLIGVGPSFASVAVDGYYVRVLTETGFVGLALYIVFLWSLARRTPAHSVVKRLILVMAITGIFIDIFVSSKAMFVLWFWLGYSVLGPTYYGSTSTRKPEEMPVDSSCTEKSSP